LKKYILNSLFILGLFNLNAQKFFLIGDAGEPKPNDKNLELLSNEFANASEEDVLIFLGDNIYPKGLPDENDPERVAMEAKLIPQLNLMNKFPGKSYMIAGNHDWAQGKSYGWKRAQNMEAFVKEYVGENVFLPENSCPGPNEIILNDYTTLILFNSQYFLHPWDKPGDNEACAAKSTIEALEELKELLFLNKGKHVILASHHPMYTYGEHHGNFSLKDHIFPLTAINHDLYIPLPVLGSIHPFYRRFIGNIQDVTNPKYRLIMKQVLEGMNQCKNVIHVSGHEHSLQLIEREGHHFIVSGSGSKTSHIKQGKWSKFAKSEQGFAVVDVDTKGDANVIFKGIDSGTLYEQKLYSKELIQPEKLIVKKSFKDSTAISLASNQYKAGKGKQRWLGENYRDIWSTEMEFDVIDLATERGGLKVLKRGGGMQTKSLRLEAENGKQYVLRSIEKFPENAIPFALRKTFAQDIVQDQISSSHPYGAYIVPPLAEAAGIYHTNPKPVIIPDDPLLGEHQKTFSGLLALYEERPNKEAAKDPYFGGGKDVEGTLDVLEKLQKDNDNIVDQDFVVRNRLFDLWIGDWDRHDDQWRWAEFKNDFGGNTYRPIPRDRDQAFFINEGIIPFWAARKWALPKIEGFDEEIDWAPGLADNARFFDRTFMSEPSWEDWEQQIKELQDVLTDEVIEQAINEWPVEIQNLSGDRIRKGLKARRADMPRYARELYLFLSKEVEVVGSDKHELFQINRLSENETQVVVFKRKKEGDLEQKVYDRIFKADETKEIRIFGRDGEDVFEFSGLPKNQLKIRVIGGTDKDLIVNATNEKLKNVLIYDRKKSTEFEGNAKGIQRLSDDPLVNFYDRKSFKYDKLFPLVNVGFNPDDGIFLGGGFILTKNGWRKSPYAHRQSLNTSIAVDTRAFVLDYEGDYKHVFGNWGLNTKFNWYNPGVINFFGVGNETEFINAGMTDAVDFYRTRVKSTNFDVTLTKPLGSKGQFYFGPGYRTVRVEQSEERFITRDFPNQPNFDEDIFKRHNYFNSTMGVSVDTRDNLLNPSIGTKAKLELRHFEGLRSGSSSFSQISGEWSFYLSAKIPSTLTLANRVGGAKNLDRGAEFFNLNALGGWTNLRGFRRTRYLGDATFYHNVDLRLKLFSFRSYLFPATLGLVAFHDVGRVWAQGEDSDIWHTGKGFGLWISPLNTLVINFNYAFGEDENLPSLRFGFLF